MVRIHAYRIAERSFLRIMERNQGNPQWRTAAQYAALQP